MRLWSFAVAILFFGLAIRDWMFLKKVEQWPAFKVVSEPIRVNDDGKRVPMKSIDEEEDRKKYDYLGVMQLMARRNFHTSTIALIAAGIVALADFTMSFYGQ